MKRVCAECKLDLPFESFSKHSKKKDGIQTSCKICVSLYFKKYRKANPEKIKAWDKANQEKRRISKNTSKKAWRKANPEKHNSTSAKYRAAKLNASPSWLTREHLIEIRDFYALAIELAWLNEGEILHVDHIVPLQGKDVCGLHVPWNLQILPAKVNSRKSNKI